MFSAVFAVAMILLQEDSRKKPAPAVTSPRVEAILADWKKASAKWRDIRFEYEQRYEDRVFGTITTRKGKVQLSRDNVLRIDISDEKGNPTEIIVQTDKGFDWYQFDTRLVYHTPSAHRTDEDLFSKLQRLIVEGPGCWAGVFLGPGSGNINGNFDVTLQKEDQYYLYLSLAPRKSAPMLFGFLGSYMDRLWIALEKKTFFVRRVDSEQANGDRNRWLVKNLHVNVTPPITAELVSRDLPKGFRVIDPTTEAPQGKKP